MCSNGFGVAKPTCKAPALPVPLLKSIELSRAAWGSDRTHRHRQSWVSQFTNLSHPEFGKPDAWKKPA